MADALSELARPIEIEGGRALGTALDPDKTVYAFKGIPFAAPPRGDLRWRPPAQALGWSGVRPCTAYGPACPQIQMPPPFDEVYNQDEDCLYLNVFTAAREARERRPVMVWIHGGGFYGGSGSTDAYEGRSLAGRGVVLVTINYRLGPLGFLAHPWLSGESERGVSGNYGLLDQIAALGWVKRNIAAFGGDPDRVTIFGESGGARSVCFQMSTPLSRGLFHRAVIQSGSPYRALGRLREPRAGLPAMEEHGAALARKLGCQSLADLRRVPAEAFVQAARARTAPLISPWPTPQIPTDSDLIAGPILDGWVLPEEPLDLFREGRQAPVPVIVGSNDAEASLFLGALAGSSGAAERLEGLFPGHVQEILAAYPEPAGAEPLAVLNRVLTDAIWTRPARALARDISRCGQKAFLYYFTKGRLGRLERFGAFHGIEIRFALGTDLTAKEPFTEEDWTLSQTMQAYWVRLAETGDPNGPGAPAWPAYEETTDLCLELGAEIKAGPHPWGKACDVFDRIDEERRTA
jgi:para-nitrobenzyl esterase